MFSRLQAHNNCHCLRAFCISRLSRCLPSHSSSFFFPPKCRCSTHPLPLLTLILFCVSYASRSPGYLFNSHFYFVLPPLHGYSHKARFFSECQTSILRNFENRFLPFSVASTPSFRHWSPPYVVVHMLVGHQAIFSSNFNARGWSSCAFGFLVASLLSPFCSRFLRGL